MDEKEIADRINQNIDALLDGRSLANQSEPGEYNEMMQVARRLARTDMSRQSRVRAALKRSLLSRLPEQNLRGAWSPLPDKEKNTMQPKTRAFVFALTALVVLILAAAATPPGRAFAQDIWQRVGPLIIVNKPVYVEETEQYGATPTPLPGTGGVPLPTPRPGEGTGQDVLAPDAHASPTPLPLTNTFEPLSNENALEKYGFQVLEPGYLPEQYALMTEHQVNRTQDGSLVSIYVYSTDSAAFDGHYLSIQQSTFEDKAPIEFKVGDAKVSQVTLRGITATFIEDAQLMTVRDEAGNNVTLPVDYLMWEEAGSFFVIDATQLTREEMIHIAESLQ